SASGSDGRSACLPVDRDRTGRALRAVDPAGIPGKETGQPGCCRWRHLTLPSIQGGTVMPARQDRGILLPLKFLIGHRAYRAASRPAALALQHTPDGVKYGIGEWMRRSKMPYSVVRPGDVVVQVGAPRDLGRAGRSRSVYFLRRVGPGGRVVVFEPDLESASYLEEYAARNGLGARLIMVRKGAWSRDDTLTFLSNPNHPASNLVKGA